MPNMWMPGAAQHPVGNQAPTNGGPSRVIWHITSNATTDGFQDHVGYFTGSGAGAAPTILWSPYTGEFAQFFPADSRALSVRNANDGTQTNRTGVYCIQIEICFTSGLRPGQDYVYQTPLNGLDQLMDWLRSLGIEDTWPAGEPTGFTRDTVSVAFWLNNGGHYGHHQVPGNDHVDPGPMPDIFSYGTGGSTPPPGGDDGERRTHTVVSGDTLWAIGQTYGVSVDQLKTWNGLESDLINVGDVLYVEPPLDNPPPEPDTHVVQTGETLSDIALIYGVTVKDLVLWNDLGNSVLVTGTEINVEDPTDPTPEPDLVPVEHTVVEGDTLSSLAAAYGVTVDQIVGWNELLPVGGSVIVGFEEEPLPPSERVTYIVQSGDTLSSIATQFGVTEADLTTWNNLAANLSEDVSSPAPVNGKSTSLTTGTFTPAAGSVLLALVAQSQGVYSTPGVSDSVDGFTGWTLVENIGNSGYAGGGGAIYYKVVGDTPSPLSVSASFDSAPSLNALAVRVLNGVQTVNPIASTDKHDWTSSTTNFRDRYNTTVAGSFVYGVIQVGDVWDDTPTFFPDTVVLLESRETWYEGSYSLLWRADGVGAPAVDQFNCGVELTPSYDGGTKVIAEIAPSVLTVGDVIYVEGPTGGTDPAPEPEPETEPEPWYHDFPGAEYFGPGASNEYVTKLGEMLIARGGGRFYNVGPGPNWTQEADGEATAAFQRAQGWSGDGANGIPGPTTWEYLVDGLGNDIPPADNGGDGGSSGRASSPVPGYSVTHAYGVPGDYAAGYHTGDDYAAPMGTACVAVLDGTIVWANGNGGAYGNWLGLEAVNGRTYVYCHLSGFAANVGESVVAGETIAYVGSTGNSTGPHLHFEDHPHGPFVYGNEREPQW